VAVGDEGLRRARRPIRRVGSASAMAMPSLRLWPACPSPAVSISDLAEGSWKSLPEVIAVLLSRREIVQLAISTVAGGGRMLCVTQKQRSP
jgi:hypothetical protein